MALAYRISTFVVPYVAYNTQQTETCSNELNRVKYNIKIVLSYLHVSGACGGEGRGTFIVFAAIKFQSSAELLRFITGYRGENQQDYRAARLLIPLKIQSFGAQLLPLGNRRSKKTSSGGNGSSLPLSIHLFIYLSIYNNNNNNWL